MVRWLELRDTTTTYFSTWPLSTLTDDNEDEDASDFSPVIEPVSQFRLDATQFIAPRLEQTHYTTHSCIIHLSVFFRSWLQSSTETLTSLELVSLSIDEPLCCTALAEFPCLQTLRLENVALNSDRMDRRGLYFWEALFSQWPAIARVECVDMDLGPMTPQLDWPAHLTDLVFSTVNCNYRALASALHTPFAKTLRLANCLRGIHYDRFAQGLFVDAAPDTVATVVLSTWSVQMGNPDDLFAITTSCPQLLFNVRDVKGDLQDHGVAACLHYLADTRQWGPWPYTVRYTNTSLSRLRRTAEALALNPPWTRLILTDNTSISASMLVELAQGLTTNTHLVSIELDNLSLKDVTVFLRRLQDTGNTTIRSLHLGTINPWTTQEEMEENVPTFVQTYLAMPSLVTLSADMTLALQTQHMVDVAWLAPWQQQWQTTQEQRIMAYRQQLVTRQRPTERAPALHQHVCAMLLTMQKYAMHIPNDMQRAIVDTMVVDDSLLIADPVYFYRHWPAVE